MNVQVYQQDKNLVTSMRSINVKNITDLMLNSLIKLKPQISHTTHASHFPS